MHAQIAAKITAFTIAVVMNSLMIVGVSVVWHAQPHECTEAAAAATVDAAHRPDPIRV
jgi:Mn2+/Fe2+ NRAMP family transporter